MKTLLISALLGIAAASQATVLYGAGGSIPDNSATGFSSSIVIPDGGTLNAILVEGLTHTWVGDITITVSGIGDIVRRIGTSSTNTVGDSSNFGGNYFASTTGGVMVTLPASIAAGSYTMTVTDSAATDTGSFTRWGIDYTPVPEPATMFILGAGALALVARRKK